MGWSKSLSNYLEGVTVSTAHPNTFVVSFLRQLNYVSEDVQ